VVVTGIVERNAAVGEVDVRQVGLRYGLRFAAASGGKVRTRNR